MARNPLNPAHAGPYLNTDVQNFSFTCKKAKPVRPNKFLSLFENSLWEKKLKWEKIKNSNAWNFFGLMAGLNPFHGFEIA